MRGRRVALPEGIRAAALHVEDGRIARITDYDVAGDADSVVDAGDRLLIPGVVDTHVHMNEPGRTEWEGIATATAAAAAGGVTTVVDMPLNCVPVTTTRAALAAKREALEARAHVDVACWGGLVPGNTGELRGLAADGVVGFKCFLCPSGVDEFPPVTRADLDAALPVLRELRLPLLVHAELPGPLARAALAMASEPGDPRAHATWLRARPTEAEEEAVTLVIDRCREHRAWAHIVHVSSATVLRRLAQARAELLSITAETCPHYLTFDADAIPDGATHFKCAPPLRDAANRERLWDGLLDGTLNLVASDHSPCPPALKRLDAGDFFDAWGGIASLQLGLSALWTGARERGIDLHRMLLWCTEAPARLAGLGGRKGGLRVGADADVVIWDEEATEVVSAATLRHRHPLTPYLGRTLRGVVESTWVRGRPVYRRATGVSSPPIGSFIHGRA